MKSLLFRFLPLVGLLNLVAFLLLASDDSLITKKVIAHLIMPAGFLWLLIWMAIFRRGLSPRSRLALVFFWLLYTLSGSPYVGSAMLRVLEAPYQAYEQPTGRLDALVLLGGGTTVSPGGRAALGNHGDRITRPAVLYHEGLIGTLVTTGRSITEEGGDRSLAKETSELWQAFQIPKESIIELSEPRNTREELDAVAALVKQHPEWKRIGLCTSASHLPRAMDEAGRVGLDLIPVPSDFRAGSLGFTPLYLVPQARGFRDVQTAMWEFLGRAF